MIDRRTFLRSVAGGLLGASAVAKGQPASRIPRIGWLAPHSPPGLLTEFQKGLRELGYIEGQNLVIEYRWAHGNFERLPGLAAELVGLKVDVLVAVVTQAALEARNATRTIPIVMVAVSGPVESGLVTNLARPGGNITGTSSLSAAVVGKQLEALTELLPGISRIGVLWNPANRVYQEQQLTAARAAARSMGVELRFVEARRPDELERAFATLAGERAQGLLVLADPMFTSHAAMLAGLEVKHRLPAVTGAKAYVEAGVLMSYGPSFADASRRAAMYVDRILKGAKPGDLPVEQPTKFELVINLRTAKALGLAIPQSLLLRADEVIR